MENITNYDLLSENIQGREGIWRRGVKKGEIVPTMKKIIVKRLYIHIF